MAMDSYLLDILNGSALPPVQVGSLDPLQIFLGHWACRILLIGWLMGLLHVKR